MASNPYNTPSVSNPQSLPSAGTRSVVVKRVDVLSCAIMAAAFYAILGLLVGGIFFLISMLGVAAGGGAEVIVGGMIGSAFIMIIGPCSMVRWDSFLGSSAQRSTTWSLELLVVSVSTWKARRCSLTPTIQLWRDR